jgi:hypothetical protein
MQGSTYTLNGATIRDTHAIGSNGVVSLTEIRPEIEQRRYRQDRGKLPNEVMWRHLQRAASAARRRQACRARRMDVCAHRSRGGPSKRPP